jgi:hypothetical protein
MNKNTTIEMIAITVRQKDSITHTKFILTKKGNPFPIENFNLTKEWMEQGLLGDEAAALIKKIIDGPVFFRGRREVPA